MTINEAVRGASVWTGREVADRCWLELTPSEWRRRGPRALGVPAGAGGIDADAKTVAASLRVMLDAGPGFAIVRGFSVDADDGRVADDLLAFAGALGNPVGQNRHGKLIDVVQDERSPGVRGAKTNKGLPYHTDMAHVVPDVFLLLVLEQAPTGGASSLVSAHTAYNSLLARRSPSIGALSRNFAFDRSDEATAGEAMVEWAPIFAWRGRRLTVRYNRARIHRGHRLTGRVWSGPSSRHSTSSTRCSARRTTI